MSIRIIYHGHSNLEIHTGPHRLQFDPAYTTNPLADVQADAVHPTYILLSHAHYDHTEDAEVLARRTGAPIIANYEMTEYYAKRGVPNVLAMNYGGGIDLPFGRVTMTLAFHSSSFPDGSNGGQPAGWIIETAGKTIYFAGDTALFGDMALIGRLWNIDLACLPIGDTFTMGPAHALLAAEMLRPKIVLPTHYNTFPPIRQDAGAFVAELAQRGLAKGIALKPGESFEL